MRFYDDPYIPRDGSLEGLGLEELERRARDGGARRALPLREWIALAEAWRIAMALRETRGNRSAAARALGIGRRTLYSKMEKLGLEPAWNVARSRSGVATRLVGNDDGRRDWGRDGASRSA